MALDHRSPEGARCPTIPRWLQPKIRRVSPIVLPTSKAPITCPPVVFTACAAATNASEVQVPIRARSTVPSVDVVSSDAHGSVAVDGVLHDDDLATRVSIGVVVTGTFASREQSFTDSTGKRVRIDRSADWHHPHTVETIGEGCDGVDTDPLRAPLVGVDRTEERAVSDRELDVVHRADPLVEERRDADPRECDDGAGDEAEQPA